MPVTSSNRCLTSSNKKLVETSATLLVTSPNPNSCRTDRTRRTGRLDEALVLPQDLHRKDLPRALLRHLEDFAKGPAAQPEVPAGRAEAADAGHRNWKIGR